LRFESSCGGAEKFLWQSKEKGGVEVFEMNGSKKTRWVGAGVATALLLAWGTAPVAAQTVTNPSFEQAGAGGSLTGWTQTGTTPNWSTNGNFPTPGTAQDGADWASISHGGGSVDSSIHQTVTVTPSVPLNLAGYIQLGGEAGTAAASVLFRDGGIGGTAFASTGTFTANQPPGASAWTAVNLSGTPTGGSVTIQIRFERDDESSSQCFTHQSAP
jgi:hypothetical protein